MYGYGNGMSLSIESSSVETLFQTTAVGDLNIGVQGEVGIKDCIDILLASCVEDVHDEITPVVFVVDDAEVVQIGYSPLLCGEDHFGAVVPEQGLVLGTGRRRGYGHQVACLCRPVNLFSTHIKRTQQFGCGQEIGRLALRDGEVVGFRAHSGEDVACGKFIHIIPVRRTQ